MILCTFRQKCEDVFSKKLNKAMKNLTLEHEVIIGGELVHTSFSDQLFDGIP